MPPVVDQMRRQAQTTLAGFSLGQKVVTAIAVLGLAIGAVMFSSWTGKPTYTMLFTNLAPSDAASITQKLTSDKVPYKLADGGQTVMVPQSQVYAERIKLSASGLPSGGQQGYSLLDKQGITTSEFTQQVDYQRALEGELSKTIGSIDGISAASVHLVVPPQDVFADSTQKPSASVLLLNTPGQTVSPGQVQAIVHLVASSVPNLDPTEVTVADAKGDMLWAPGQDGATMAAGDQRQAATDAFQTNLAQSIQQMLATVIGPNHAVVRVTADLSYDQQNTTTESYDTAHNPIAVNQTTSNENYQGSSANAAAGQIAPTNGATTTGSNPTSYTKVAAATNYAIGKVTAQVTKAPGSVNRLSVAVALDSKVSGISTSTVQNLVSAAAGIDPARGDTVNVSVLPFDTSSAAAATKELKAAAAAKTQAGMMGLIRTAVVCLVLLVVVFLLIRASRRSPQRLPIALGPDLSLEPGRALGAGIHGADDTSEALSMLSPAPANAPAIANLIASQPDQVAELLRGWLTERPA